MGNRADEIRKRIEKRRRNQANPVRKQQTKLHHLYEEEDWNIGGDYSIYEADPPSEKIHPLWNKEFFIFKILVSALLVLVVGILFKTSTPQFDNARTIVNKVMKTEFQFAAVSNWYEDQFGKPLAFLPLKNDKKEPTKVATQDYAIPAMGKVLRNFSSDGRGVMVETRTNVAVEAIASGTVIFAGKKDDLGNTIIIQHADKSESWYANLSSIDVKEYDHVIVKDKVGAVTNKEDGVSGEYYFAIKQGEEFIDPIQVIKFEK